MTNKIKRSSAKHALATAALGACVFMNVVQAASVELSGTSVGFAFDTADWYASVGGASAFNQLSAQVSGNVLTLDFGQNLRAQSRSTQYANVSMNWFRLPVQYTLQQGWKVDGYRVTIAGTWATWLDQSAQQAPWVGAGLRTDGAIWNEPTINRFTLTNPTHGSAEGSFLRVAMLDGTLAPSFSGQLLAVAQAGVADCPDPQICQYLPQPEGRAEVQLRTLSFEVLTSPVPEPASTALLLAGLGILGVCRFRRS